VLKSAEPLDVLVSDLVLPGGRSGAEVAREAQRLRPHVRVLLVSGYVGGSVSGLVAAGNFEILQKPFTAEQLLSKLGARMARAE